MSRYLILATFAIFAAAESGRAAFAATNDSAVTETTADASKMADAAGELGAFKKAIRRLYDLQETAFEKQDVRFVDQFYTADTISIGEGDGIFIGREQLRKVYERDVKFALIKITSVHTYVRGSSGWDWTDYRVTPSDKNTKPFSYIILYLWTKVNDRWMCQGESYVGGSFGTGLSAPPPPPG